MTGSKISSDAAGILTAMTSSRIILQQPVCSQFIAGELFKYFAYENTDASLATALGQLLLNNHYQIRPLLRTILTSRAFYSPRFGRGADQEPGAARGGNDPDAGAPDAAGPAVESALNQMGQLPLMPPNVRGWVGGRMWINTSTLFIRYNTGVWLAGGQVPALTRYNRKGAPRTICWGRDWPGPRISIRTTRAMPMLSPMRGSNG